MALPPRTDRAASTHEDMRRDDDGAPPSERSFGWVFTALFLLVAGVRWWSAHADARWWLGAAALTLLIGYTLPRLLRPLNRLWWRFGLLLHRLISPLVMGLMFFAAVLPVGLLMRAFGKDPLRLKRDPKASTYWIACDLGQARPERMKDQF